MITVKNSIEFAAINTPGEECVAMLIKDGDNAPDVIRFPAGTSFTVTFNNTEKTVIASADPIPDNRNG